MAFLSFLAFSRAARLLKLMKRHGCARGRSWFAQPSPPSFLSDHWQRVSPHCRGPLQGEKGGRLLQWAPRGFVSALLALGGAALLRAPHATVTPPSPKRSKLARTPRCRLRFKPRGRVRLARCLAFFIGARSTWDPPSRFHESSTALRARFQGRFSVSF